MIEEKAVDYHHLDILDHTSLTNITSTERFLQIFVAFFNNLNFNVATLGRTWWPKTELC